MSPYERSILQALREEIWAGGAWMPRRELLARVGRGRSDLRDVEPLVAALRQALGCCQEVAHEVEDPTQACAEIEALTRDALKAFEDEEGSGG